MVGLSTVHQETFIEHDKVNHLNYVKRSSPQAQSRSLDRSVKSTKVQRNGERSRIDKISSEKADLSSGQSLSESSISNLNQFLEFTTPSVHLQYLPKSCFWDQFSKRWKQVEAESVPFYSLGDLWESFDEWSAYGAGVPLFLKGEESVVQYYVPYLSALQLYSRSDLRCCFSSRKLGEESDASSDGDVRDTSSEASSDGEIDGVLNLERGKSFRNLGEKLGNPGLCNIEKKASLSDCCSRRNSYGKFESVINEEKIWEDRERPCCLFEYLERAAPYSRVPLVDKISELAGDFPRLKTLRSVELSTESWLSIAWYPIYRIPTGPTLRDLATCFLTFHSLSTPFQGLKNNVDPPLQTKRMLSSHISVDRKLEKASLQSFGLASYKLRGAFWTSAGNSEHRMARDLQESAEFWLKQRSVQHPDFDFFMSHTMAGREKVMN